MARTTVTPQTLSNAGITPTYNAATATDGDAFANDGNTFIHVKNASSQVTLTIQTPATVSGVAIAEQTVTIPATTGDKMIGPFNTTVFSQADGKVYLDWSGVTGVTFAVIKM